MTPGVGAQGVPARVEVGPRDVEQGTCVVARRDRPGKEGKTFGVPMEPAAFLSAIQVSSSCPVLNLNLSSNSNLNLNSIFIHLRA